MAQRLFGTDGIRGKVGTNPLTSEMIFKIGQGVGLWLKKNKPQGTIRIVIARDTRASGGDFEQAISHGLIVRGCDVFSIGVMPTPSIAYFVKRKQFDLGVVISASHNEAEENGIKFFDCNGFKICEDSEREIEKIVYDIQENEYLSSDRASYSSLPIKKIDFKKDYIDSLIAGAGQVNLKGKKLVIDCAQGALSHIGEDLFKKLGAEIISINDTPNGDNVNLNAGALHPEIAAKYVLEHKADAGFSFDGDGDRVIAIDENGNILDGDFIMTILAKNLLVKNRLSNNTVICTHMSNGGLDIALKSLGVNVFRVDIGDRFVLKEMLDKGAVLGGEQSGHIIFLDCATAADSLVTTLQMLRVMVEESKSLGELSNCMSKLPQLAVNIKVKTKKPFDDISGLNDLLNDYKAALESQDGRVLLRYSGTESVARIMIEGQKREQIEEMAHSLAEKIQNDIGVD